MLELNFNQTDLLSVENIEIPERFYRRMMTGIETVDEFLHEGFLPGSTMTLTAAAGCGKTTFMIQLLEGLTKNGYSVGYCSGEENIYQLAMTCRRLQCTKLQIANKTDVDEIVKLTKTNDFLVIDSFQALTTSKKMNSLEKERYALMKLVKAAQENECCVCFIMHLTKAGKLKGTTLVPHTVDANLNIMIDAEVDDQARRIWFSKNRFGPTNELTLMMTHSGYDMYSKVVSKDNKYVSKKNQKEVIKDDLKKKKLDSVNVNQICSQYKVSVVYANSALRELVAEGAYQKIGRGDNATWQVCHIIK